MSRVPAKTSTAAPFADSGAGPSSVRPVPGSSAAASATVAASLLAPSGVCPPETILFTVEPITITSQGITYRTERTTLPARPIPGVQTSPPPEPPEPDQAERSSAAKVFQLLTALDPDSRLRKAPPIKVFLLRFRQNCSRSEIARICRCGKSLVALRLATIQQRLPWKPQQLRQLSAHVEAMQDAVSDSRARSIYRKGAIYGDEGGDEESS